MAETVAAVLAAARVLLDEITARRWEDPSLRRWAWEASQDIARRTWCNDDATDVVIAGGANEVTIPATVYKVRDVVWVPGGGDPREIPLDGQPWDILNRLWAQNPATSGDPRVWTVRGRPPTAKLRVYPAPAASSTLRLYGPTIPASWDFTTPSPADSAKTIDVPDGWTDLVVHFVVMKACLADRDATGTGWQTYANLYEAGITQLIENDELATFTRQIARVPTGPWAGFPYYDD